MPTTDPTARAVRPRGEDGRIGAILAVVVVLAVVAGVGLAWRLGLGPLPDPDGCVAEVGDTKVTLSAEQARHAATIAAVAVGRDLPARAVSIALATAFQESKLRNLDYGDRDSLGLFQQRPSQGWGTPKQVRDPVYASNAFYDALEKIPDYQSMRITEAAQAVQRSGYPEAYEEHAPGARALASALTGYSPARFTCVSSRGDTAFEDPTDTGLTPRAERVRRQLESVFGPLSLGGFAPEGVTDGHMPGSTHYEGRAVDVFFRPVNEANRRKGWAVANYLAAHAERLDVQHVIFDGRIWTSGRSSERGWREYRPDVPRGASQGTKEVLLHRDHVHVDVIRGD